MAATTPSKGNGESMPPAAPTPMLYTRLEPLNRDKHGALRLSAPDDFAFARNAGVAPVTLSEFAVASQYYPIVFLTTRGAAELTAVAVLGSGPSENVYVDSAGRWRPGHYVPAYFRRYPFITADDPKQNRAVVFIDAGSSKLSAKEGTPLFFKGEPTELGKQTIELCQRYHQAAGLTRRFTSAMVAAGVLVDRVIQASDQKGGKIAWQGLKAVDQKKLTEVDGKTFLQWRDRNWLAPIYLHQHSLGHFGEIAATKLAAAGAKPLGKR